MPSHIENLFIDKIRKIIIPSGFYFRQNGYCPCCDREVVFKSTNSWLRDYFLCSNCGCYPRERAIMLTIEKYYCNWSELKIHESSPVGRGTSLKLQQKAGNYVATQFYPDKPFGVMINNFRNEDLENQTFSDNSFDIVVTQDVMEHVYNPEKAFREIARTLKKGGAHIFTVPIINRHQPTEVWAIKGDDGNPVFYEKPEYHGNFPVTMHWGFDIIDFIKSRSGLETIVEYIDNLDFGIRAELIEVLVSKK